MNWFVNNREVIKNLSIDTGTSGSPAYTAMCTTSEVGLTTDLEEKDFYVFCDAIKRSIITGVKMSIDCTVKLDINNTAIQGILGKVHAMLANGSVAQFNNVLVQFDLLLITYYHMCSDYILLKILNVVAYFRGVCFAENCLDSLISAFRNFM